MCLLWEANVLITCLEIMLLPVHFASTVYSAPPSSAVPTVVAAPPPASVPTAPAAAAAASEPAAGSNQIMVYDNEDESMVRTVWVNRIGKGVRVELGSMRSFGCGLSQFDLPKGLDQCDTCVSLHPQAYACIAL